MCSYSNLIMVPVPFNLIRYGATIAMALEVMPMKKAEDSDQDVRHKRARLPARLVAASAAVATALLGQDPRPGDPLRGWSTAGEAGVIDLVQVEQSKLLPSTTEFVLKNSSNKAITGFALTCEDMTNTIDFFNSGTALRQGETYRLSVSDRELSGRDRIVTVAAIVFEDGTAQGAQEQIEFIWNSRWGQLFEIERVRKLLESQTEAPEGVTGAAALKAELGALPKSPAEAFDSVQGVQVPEADLATIRAAGSRGQHGFLVGVRNTRERALWRVDQLLRGASDGNTLSAVDWGKQISNLRELYRALSTSSHEFLARAGKGAAK